MHADKVNITKAHVQRELRAPTEYTPEEQECLQSLFFTEMHWRKNDLADPAPATCAWLMHHRTYREWLNQGHGLLWIKGNPGTGKSTVLKHALETAEQPTKQRFILASFFFHGRGAPTQKSTLGLFRSLLHQILQQNGDLLSKFTHLYKTRCTTDGIFTKTWGWQTNELQHFFKLHVVDAARTQQIRIYIDALDECGEDVATDLVEFFRCFAGPISICFSCRHYPFVALEGGDEICVEDENQQDIEIYVQAKIEAHIHRTDIAKTLQNEVVSRSQGNFQWVVLVIPRVLALYKNRKPIATIQAMIQKIPPELHELYTRLLSLIEDQERAQSLHFMHWICFSFRPLTVIELRFALAINPDIPHTSVHQCPNSEFYVDIDEDMKRVVYDLSKGLAEVQKHGSTQVVQFIHQSVQDFLLEKGFQVLNNSIAGNVIGHGHLWISRSCIEYLSTEEVQNFAASLRGKSEARLTHMEKSDYLGLFKYSSNYWLGHLQMLEDANMSQDDLAALSTKASDLMLYDGISSYCTSVPTSLLHIATYYNLVHLGRAVLTRTVRVDRTDAYGQTHLSIAAEKGHAILVELLLGRDDIDVNHKDFRGGTPLSSAAREGHYVVVKLLLNREDVNADHKDILGDTPLSLAATKGHEAVVELLMNRKDVDLNSMNHYGDTPLSKAAQQEHTAIVRMLLDRGDVNANYSNLQGNTSLYLAAADAHTATVKVLLQGNAKSNIRGNSGRTALGWAAAHGDYELVELLLQHKIDVDFRDIDGIKPLSSAALRGHWEVVKLLLPWTTNPDSVDNFGRTPLSLAASMGHCEVVKLLLQRTSNADSSDKSGRTPLSHACGSGHKEIVEELMRRSDVDVNSRDIYCRSVLYWAVESYFASSTDFDTSKHIVDLLLRRHDILIGEAEEDALEKFSSEERRPKAISYFCF